MACGLPKTAPDGPPAATRSRTAPPTLFMCGDLMCGRGIDQVLHHPGAPQLHEPFVRSARDYVRLAEQASGPIQAPLTDAAVWGEALAILEQRRPQHRIVNLETAITAGGSPEAKGINYRMHPDNIGLLRTAGIDVCTLANNHVLDWGAAGLLDTLATLAGAGIASVGAGVDAQAAWRPAELRLGDHRRLLLYACASPCSGVPAHWAARAHTPGIARLDALCAAQALTLSRHINARRACADAVIVSIHWGENWGYAIPDAQRAFAHALIDAGAADIVCGHSSHHAKGIEVHRGRLILYGCGDLLNDYEGIGGHEAYRADLGLMVFPTLAEDGALRALELVPTRLRRLRIERATAADCTWLLATLNRECAPGHRR